MATYRDSVVLAVLILLLGDCYGVAIDNDTSDDRKASDEIRDGRWFLGKQTVTKLLVDNLVVKTVVPSSCLAFEPSILPCRNRRFLYFGSSSPSSQPASPSVLTKATPPLQVQGVAAQQSSSSEGYFAFIRDKTVTQTATRITTKTYYDSNKIVTFSVKGCIPSELPYNLARCDEKPLLNPTPIVQPIVATLPPTAPPKVIEYTQPQISAPKEDEVPETRVRRSISLASSPDEDVSAIQEEVLPSKYESKVELLYDAPASIDVSKHVSKDYASELLPSETEKELLLSTFII